jgi:death on curing protein
VTEYLDLADVLKIHADLHGDNCARDIGLVESAVARPQAIFLGEDAYPTLAEKAAALLHSLVCNHPFTDANHRTVWRSAWSFLDLNGQPLAKDYDVDAALAFMLSVTNAMAVSEIAATLMQFGDGAG